jgi:hypothetical protein
MIDIDGVLAEFTGRFSEEAVTLGILNKTFYQKDQTQWAYRFDDAPVWRKVKDTFNWWMTLEPSVDREEVAFLNDVIENHSVYFITSRPRTKGLSADMQSRYWLSSIGIKVDHASVIATQTGKKGMLCMALDLDVAIEDMPDNVRDIRQHGTMCYTRRWPYNDTPEFAPHVDSLGEFLMKVG